METWVKAKSQKEMVYGKKMPRPGVIEKIRRFCQQQGMQKVENSKSSKVNPQATTFFLLLLLLLFYIYCFFFFFLEKVDWRKAVSSSCQAKEMKPLTFAERFSPYLSWRAHSICSKHGSNLFESSVKLKFLSLYGLHMLTSLKTLVDLH